MSPNTYESVTPDLNLITIEAKNRILCVTLPLTVTLDDCEIYCETADGYEVWYFHEQEFAEHAENIPEFVAESLTNPADIVVECAPHIVSYVMDHDPSAFNATP